MDIKTYIGIGLLTLAVFLSLTLILHLIVKTKRTSVFYSFITVQVVVLIWSTGLIFELLSPDKHWKWIIVRIEYFAVSLIGLSWLMFSLFYTENKILKNKKKLIPLFVLPIIFYSLLLSNDTHNMFYKEFEYEYRVYGLFFWFHVLTEYIYIFTGTLLIIRYSVKQIRSKKVQSILVICTSLIPVISNILYVFKLVNINIDITPISFSVSMILFSIAIFKYRLLDMVSIGLKTAVDNMKEPIIIVDNLNKIVNFNKAFKNMLDYENEIKVNDDICNFAIGLKPKLLSGHNVLEIIERNTAVAVSVEFILKDEELKYYTVNIQPIYDSSDTLLGRVITFSDVSEYKKLMEVLDKKNSALVDINEKLKEHLTTAAELASEKERNRIAQEVHDTLGHTMTLLISLLEVCKITYREDPAKTEHNLSEALNISRGGLKELRESITHIKSYKMKSEDFIRDLRVLISGFELTGIKIELVIDGVNNKLTANHAEILYRVCKEALTNSLRHGKAENVSIILKFIDDKIKLFILDDGCGCTSINKGLGLRGMEERIENIDGSIVYGSDGERGFNIHIEIPLGGDIENDKNINS